MTLTIGVSISLMKSISENNNLRLELSSAQWKLNQTQQYLRDQLNDKLISKEEIEYFLKRNETNSSPLNGINLLLKEMNEALNKLPNPSLSNYIKVEKLWPKENDDIKKG